MKQQGFCDVLEKEKYIFQILEQIFDSLRRPFIKPKLSAPIAMDFTIYKKLRSHSTWLII